MIDGMLLLGVPAERIRVLGDAWSDGGLWDDIGWLALLMWAAADDDERRMRWHHLVMTVGNFKRQGGRRLRPARISPARNGIPVGVQDQLCIPDGLLVARDEEASWGRLQRSLHGAAVATTTSLLAALWPDSHHILDWRVLAAVAGLDAVAGDDGNLRLVAPGSRDQLQPTLELYSGVRALLVTFAGEACLPVRTVERALYVMSRGVQGKGMTWAEYGQALTEVLPPQETADTGGVPDDEQEMPPSAP